MALLYTEYGWITGRVPIVTMSYRLVANKGCSWRIPKTKVEIVLLVSRLIMANQVWLYNWSVIDISKLWSGHIICFSSIKVDLLIILILSKINIKSQIRRKVTRRLLMLAIENFKFHFPYEIFGSKYMVFQYMRVLVFGFWTTGNGVLQYFKMLSNNFLRVV